MGASRGRTTSPQQRTNTHQFSSSLGCAQLSRPVCRLVIRAIQPQSHNFGVCDSYRAWLLHTAERKATSTAQRGLRVWVWDASRCLTHTGLNRSAV